MKIYLLLVVIILSIHQSYPQSLTGISGMFSIPIATINKDGEFTSGINYIERKYLKYANGNRDIINFYVYLNYLPFLEIGLRATRQLNYQGKSHTVDRMFNFKIKLIEEKKYLPVIAFGMNNPVSTEVNANHFNSTYLVITKNIYLSDSTQALNITLGYGSDLIKAADYQFIGFFGGVSYKPFNFMEVMIEYDAERFNSALRFTLLNHIKILAGFMGMKDFSGGIGYSFVLQ